jgi:DNA/RNA-binding domain of Phe-tRNA-synthetase-like protein
MEGGIIIAASWKEKFPDSRVGILIVTNIANATNHPALAAKRKSMEEELRVKFAGMGKEEIGELPVIRAYRNHYDKFHETYHVRLQLESIIRRGLSRPNQNGLIEAMFIPELKNLMLTAGHDLKETVFPVIISASTGKETFTTIRGQEQKLKPEDMIMSDREGVISSVLYGPDSRTRINHDTKNALYVTYAPAGIEEKSIVTHLNDIADNIKEISPEAQIEELTIFG